MLFTFDQIHVSLLLILQMSKLNLAVDQHDLEQSFLKLRVISRLRCRPSLRFPLCRTPGTPADAAAAGTGTCRTWSR